MPVSASDFCVVTSFFNPCGYETRLNNFRLFRDGLERARVPWLVVECAFGDAPFVLEESPNVLRVRGRDLMWQKERLLNIALEHLPATFRKVAWIDCDVIFENEDWVAETARALEDYSVVQLFDCVVRLPRTHNLDESNESFHSAAGESYAGFASVYQRDPHLLKKADFERHGHTGFAWAARRELLARHGLYDACVAGSGDHLMAHALCGDLRDECVGRVLGHDSRHLKHFAAWANGIRADVCGRVGFVRGTLLHLWHGDKRNRRYLSRNRRLASFDFDPARDLRKGQSGCWEWASAKPELHRWLVDYFDGRAEDGQARRLSYKTKSLNQYGATHNQTRAVSSLEMIDDDAESDS